MEEYEKDGGDSYLCVTEVEKLKLSSSSLCRLLAKNSDSREYMTAVKLIRLMRKNLEFVSLHIHEEERWMNLLLKDCVLMRSQELLSQEL